MGRVKQALQHFFGALTPADHAWMETILSDSERRIFEKMHRADQYHCFQVARELAEAPTYVIKAALLHDCGKPGDFGFLARSIAVITRRFPLPIFQEIQRIRREHPDDGATLLAGVLDEQALELVRHHQDSEIASGWLKALQEADQKH